MYKSYINQKNTVDYSTTSKSYDKYKNSLEPIVDLKELKEYMPTLDIKEEEIDKIYKLRAKGSWNEGFVILYKNNVKPMRVVYKYNDPQNFTESIIKLFTTISPELDTYNNNEPIFNLDNQKRYIVFDIISIYIMPILLIIIFGLLNFHIILLFISIAYSFYPLKRLPSILVVAIMSIIICYRLFI